MATLTPRQAELLTFIEEYQWEQGSSPTLREMREHFGVSSDNGILKHLKGLEEKGYLQKDDTPRGIKRLDTIKQRMERAANVLEVPLVGTIPAGGPVAAQENILGTFEIGRDLMKMENGAFLLRVSGNSMVGAGIYEGDMVLVAPGKEPRSGDIVVALVDGHSTVKRYIEERGKRYLKAENPEYEDIHPEEELQTQGLVVGLIRNY